MNDVIAIAIVSLVPIGLVALAVASWFWTRPIR
jgi:hypothetical protein